VLRPNYLCAGKIAKSEIKLKGSSKSRRASKKSGYLYLTKWFNDILGLLFAKCLTFPRSPLAFARLNFFIWTFWALNLVIKGSKAKKLMSLDW
jgi:hypothetical protein